MWIRYRAWQTAVTLLVVLGSVAVGGTWAWAQQGESNPAAQQGDKCPGAEELGTIGPDDKDLVRVRPFEIEGDKFRITYKTTKLDEDGEPLLDVTVLDEDEDELGGRVIRDQVTEREVVTEAPGRFSMEIRAQDLTYEITIEDCTGEDRSAADDQYDDDLDVDDAPGLGENFGLGSNPGIGDNLGLGDDPGSGTGDGQDAGVPEDVIADTIPDRETLPFTGGPPLFGLALIGLACTGLGIAVLRSVIRRP